MNKVCITGRLVADVVRVNESMVRGTIAVKTFTKEGVNYFDFLASNQVATTFENYAGKGSLVGLVGRLMTSSFEDKDGKKHVQVKIFVEDLTLLDKAPEKEEDPKAKEKKSTKKTTKKTKKSKESVVDEDLPF